MWNTLYMCKQRRPGEIQTPNALELDRPQHGRPAACYCPAVFFRCDSLALSFPHGEIWLAFQFFHSFLIF
jgi:hypothetical protein